MKQSRLQTSYLYFVYLAMSVLVICSLLARFRIINDTLCSLSDLILPLVYLIVFIVLIISYFLSLYRDIFWKNLFIFVGTPLLLWPPLWLLRTTPPSRVETQVVRISTWNVARMGFVPRSILHVRCSGCLWISVYWWTRCEWNNNIFWFVFE